MMENKTKNSGGARLGAGAKKIFTGPTTRIYITVPVSKKKEIKLEIENILSPYKKNQ